MFEENFPGILGVLVSINYLITFLKYRPLKKNHGKCLIVGLKRTKFINMKSTIVLFFLIYIIYQERSLSFNVLSIVLMCILMIMENMKRLGLSNRIYENGLLSEYGYYPWDAVDNYVWLVNKEGYSKVLFAFKGINKRKKMCSIIYPEGDDHIIYEIIKNNENMKALDYKKT